MVEHISIHKTTKSKELVAQEYQEAVAKFKETYDPKKHVVKVFDRIGHSWNFLLATLPDLHVDDTISNYVYYGHDEFNKFAVRDQFVKDALGGTLLDSPSLLKDTRELK